MNARFMAMCRLRLKFLLKVTLALKSLHIVQNYVLDVLHQNQAKVKVATQF